MTHIQIQIEDLKAVPWCKKGDWVLISKYSGHRFEYDNVEMRLLNDDAILATLDDPTKVSRATT